jgi:hypothetical protein
MGDFDRGQTATAAGNVMLGAGAAALVTGGALFLLGAPPDAPAPPMGSAPGASPAGAQKLSSPSGGTGARPVRSSGRSGLAGVPGADVGLSFWRSF